MTTAERLRALLPVPGEKEVISIQLESTTIMAEAEEIRKAVIARQPTVMTPPVHAVRRQPTTSAPAPHMFLQAKNITWSKVWPYTALAPFLIPWRLGAVVQKGLYRMSRSTTDKECISNRHEICERKKIWGPPKEDNVATRVPPARETADVRYRGAQREMRIHREIMHRRTHKPETKTRNL